MESHVFRQSGVVSMRGLVRRINRALPELVRLRIARAWYSDLGNFYIHDFNTNIITAGHVDPEAMGRRMGVLKPHEWVLR